MNTVMVYNYIILIYSILYHLYDIKENKLNK